MEEIKIAPEVLFYFGPVKITNSLFTCFIVSFLIIIFSLLLRKKIALIPSGFYNFIESAFENVFSFITSNLGKEGEKYFPLIVTIFFYVLLNNWFGILPFINGVSLSDKHLFRSTFSDINMTLGLALGSMIAVHFLALKELKLNHLKKFFNFSNPINFFIGILELISEFSKIFSFSFRLFGNIFAGEVLLVIIGFLVPLVASVPFMGLEIFVGFIQALIFASLIMIFLKISLEHH